MKLELFRELGLTEYEAKAYAALLEYGAMPSRRIAELSGVPFARIYDTLRSLADKELAAMIRKEPMTFEALTPSVALESFISKKKDQLKHLEDDVLKEIGKIGRKVPLEGKEFVKVYFGEQHRFARTQELHPLARKTIHVISRSETLPNALMKEIRRDVSRGVDYKLITTEITEANKPILKRYLRAGAKIKYYPAIYGFNQVVFDRSTTYQVLFDPTNEENVCVVVIHNPGLAKAAENFFESVWKKAEEVKL